MMVMSKDELLALGALRNYYKEFGHGHVMHAGAVARCGGPAICAHCKREKLAVDLLLTAGDSSFRVWVPPMAHAGRVPIDRYVSPALREEICAAIMGNADAFARHDFIAYDRPTERADHSHDSGELPRR